MGHYTTHSWRTYVPPNWTICDTSLYMCVNESTSIYISTWPDLVAITFLTDIPRYRIVPHSQTLRFFLHSIILNLLRTPFLCIWRIYVKIIYIYIRIYIYICHDGIDGRHMHKKWWCEHGVRCRRPGWATRVEAYSCQPLGRRFSYARPSQD